MSTETEIEVTTSHEMGLAPAGPEVMLERALAELRTQEKLVAAVGEQHKLVLSCNQALTEGNATLREKLEKTETAAAQYKAKLIIIGAIPDEPKTPLELAREQFAATQADAGKEMLSTAREDRALLLNRLRQAENLLREAAQFSPNPERIREFLEEGGG